MIGDTTLLDGYRVIETPLLPMDPDWGEQAKRIVRHGLSDILSWLGEPIGPEPDFTPRHIFIGGHTIFASPEMTQTIRRVGQISKESKPEYKATGSRPRDARGRFVRRTS